MAACGQAARRSAPENGVQGGPGCAGFGPLPSWHELWRTAAGRQGRRRPLAAQQRGCGRAAYVSARPAGARCSHDLHPPIHAAPNLPIWTAAIVRILDVQAAPNAGYSRLASARVGHGTWCEAARALTGEANLGQEIVGRGALAGRIRPLQHRRLLAVTPRRSTKDGPVGCDRRPPATASGAEVGQMTCSQLALNGCDDARRSTRNPRKIGVSASSVAVQHCCGPGCHDVDVHLPGASQTPTPARSLLGLAISHRSQDLVRGSLLPGYAANGDRSAASTAPVPPEVDLGCCPCPGGPVHRTAPPCCPAVTARLSSRPAPPAWCADTSPGPAVIWEAGHGAGRGSVA